MSRNDSNPIDIPRRSEESEHGATRGGMRRKEKTEGKAWRWARQPGGTQREPTRKLLVVREWTSGEESEKCKERTRESGLGLHRGKAVYIAKVTRKSDGVEVWWQSRETSERAEPNRKG
jgi:hypothetical protein